MRMHSCTLTYIPPKRERGEREEERERENGRGREKERETHIGKVAFNLKLLPEHWQNSTC